MVFLKSIVKGLLKMTVNNNINTSSPPKDKNKTYIYIGTGTCGLGAGADKTMAKTQQYIVDKGLDAEVVEVGCIGLCTVEPILDVELPGRNRVSFQNVTENKVDTLLDAVIGGNFDVADTLCQHRDDDRKQWDGVAFIDEHPFFAPQNRWVLKNCGLIDPASIDEYITFNGTIVGFGEPTNEFNEIYFGYKERVEATGGTLASTVCTAAFIEHLLKS
jgi:(2Fe-2S) ferredoxin